MFITNVEKIANNDNILKCNHTQADYLLDHGFPLLGITQEEEFCFVLTPSLKKFLSNNTILDKLKDVF